MKRKRYSAEFKGEAARLMIMDGLSAPEVSERPEVNTGLLYKSRREHLAELDASSSAGEKSSSSELAAEIEQVRKQPAKENRINQILKKTVRYFAQER